MVLNAEAKSIFPFTTDKALVDLVNGMRVSKELNEIQKQRLSLLHRVIDGVSGKSAMRQAHINDHVNTSLEVVKTLTQELTKDIEKHSVALITVNEYVANLQSNVAELADFTLNLKQELIDLKNDFSSQKRLVLAEQQVSRLMAKWEAGSMNQLSPIGRCYAVLDALYWGAFGHRMRQDKDAVELLDDLRNKLIIRLRNDLGVERDRDVIRDEWLKLPENTDKPLQEALMFQGDWCLESPKDFSTTFTATQWNLLPTQARIENQNVPFAMMDIERATKRLINDKFGV